MNRTVKQKTNTGLFSNDVRVDISLPPAVQGQLHCFLAVKVDCIAWKIKNHPKDIQVCLKWWGQIDDGTTFWPSSKKVTSKQHARTNTSVLYPVCSGPKQFAAYLHDMGILVLDVLHSKTLKPFGKVEIHEIVDLTASSPIDRWYDVTSLSVQPVKFADLHVVLKFEPVDVVGQKLSLPAPVIDQNYDEGKNEPVAENVRPSEVFPTKCHEKESTNDQHDDDKVTQVTNDDEENDVISLLIKKGTKLRDSMFESHVNEENIEVQDDVDKDETVERHIPGGLLRQILQREVDDVMITSPQDTKLPVDLILDDDVSDEMYNSTSSLASDSADLLYDETLLQDLFYDSKIKPSVSMLFDGSRDESNIVCEQETAVACDETSKHQKILSERDVTKPVEQNPAVPHQDDDHIQQMPEPVRDNSDVHLSAKGNTSLLHGHSAESVLSEALFARLGINKLTALGRVTAARVAINKLNIAHQLGEETNNRTSYFIEYEFPVAASSGCSSSDESVALEMTRIATKKTSAQCVVFNHHSVFPVFFNSNVTSFWWNFALKVKVLERQSGQKTPVVVGVGMLDLKTILTSRNLHYNGMINIKLREHAEKTGHSSASSIKDTMFGQLELKIDLMSNGKDLNYEASESELARDHEKRRKENLKRYLPQNTHKVERVEQQHPAQVYVKHETNIASDKRVGPNITLMTLLWVSEGKSITENGHGFRVSVPGSTTRSNFYIISRMFWTNDTSKSAICWGQTDPKFNFKQVSPVLLTTALLDRMHNNFVTLEVWNKAGGGLQEDQLVGLVKLPLQQLYLSYKNEQTTNALLKSKFPVVAVDGWVKIKNPFKDTCQGELRLLLAMGSEIQVSKLQDIKQFSAEYNAELLPNTTNERPQQLYSSQTNTQENHVEHSFEIIVQSVRKLFAFEKTLWGETDCFVQYTFPHQTTDIGINTNDIAHEDVPRLQNHRTSTTLCVPDTTFNDVARYSITLPRSLPVQRYLLAAYHGSWSSVVATAAGIMFELWKRHYYPNIRDQLVAKCLLPLAKLCGMVTMQKTDEASVQSFSLPLTTLPTSEDKTSSDHDGLLDLTIKYRHSSSHVAHVTPTKRITLEQNTQVYLSIEINRACGLKCALRKLAEKDSSLAYASEVGGNAFVKLKLPFHVQMNERVTRTVARTFTPEFGYRMEFGLPLVFRERMSQSSGTLAESLENGQVVFEIWHQRSRETDFNEDVQQVVNGFVRRQFTPTSDVLLGAVHIPLQPLLYSHTGINDWFPVHERKSGREKESISRDLIEETVGGLEVKINFGDGNDREKVIDSARAIGWSLPMWYEIEDGRYFNDSVDNDTGVNIGQALSFQVAVKSIWIPKLIIRAAQFQHGLKEKKMPGCYIRYKFYDTKAVFSPVCGVKKLKESDVVVCNLKHRHSYMVKTTSPFIWYMREEKLEIQVWLAPTHDGDTALPNKRDKLVGSAFIHLFPLLGGPNSHSELSGVHPLFRSSAVDLGGAGLHAHLVLQKPSDCKQLCPSKVPCYDVDDDVVSTDQTSNLLDDDKMSISLDSTDDAKHGGALDNDVQEKETSSSHDNEDDDVIAAHVVVQQALHLPFVDKTAEKMVSPSVYVTYQPSPRMKTVKTKSVRWSTSLLWDHEKLIKFRRSEIGRQILAFKVWYSHSKETREMLSETDRGTQDVSVGIASVDLSPLTSGFRQVVGWYNVVDFNGQCQGQIKVGIIPLLPVLSQPSSMAPQQLSAGYLAIDKRSETSSAYPSTKPAIEESTHSGVSLLQNVVSTTEQVADSSKSFLLRQLRQNMSELDAIKEQLSQRLVGNSEIHKISERTKEELDEKEDKSQSYVKNDDLINTKFQDKNELLSHMELENTFKDRDLSSPKHDGEECNLSDHDGVFEKFDESERHACPVIDEFLHTNERKEDIHEDTIIVHEENELDVQPNKTRDHLEDYEHCDHKNNSKVDVDLGNIDEYHDDNYDNDEHNQDSLTDLSVLSGNSDAIGCGDNTDTCEVAIDESLDSFFDISSLKTRENMKQPCAAMDDYAGAVVNRRNLEKLKSVMNEESDPEPGFPQLSDDGLTTSSKHETCSKEVHLKRAADSYVVGDHNVSGDSLGEEHSHQPGLDKRFQHDLAKPLSSIPNFFMPPKDLEQSMRSLRIAATFRKEPRWDEERRCGTAQDKDERFVSSRKSVSESYKNWKQLEKVRSTGQVPLSSEETSRLARIFSATYSSSSTE